MLSRKPAEMFVFVRLLAQEATFIHGWKQQIFCSARQSLMLNMSIKAPSTGMSYLLTAGMRPSRGTDMGVLSQTGLRGKQEGLATEVQ